MRPIVISTVLACLLAAAAAAEGPPARMLGADIARLAPGADDPDAEVDAAETDADCAVGAIGDCPEADVALDR